MNPTIESLNASTNTLNDITACLNETGAVIVEEFVEAAAVQQINSEIDSVMSATKDGRVSMSPAHQFFFGEQTRHIAGIAGRSRTFVDEVMLNPLALGICDNVLLPNCASYQLNLAHVLDRGPASTQQMLHRDDEIYSHLPRPFPGQVMLAALIALNDFSLENGATRIAPGSHSWDPERKAKQEDLAAAVMPAGSAVFYLGRTIHGGGPNTTENQRRRGMHLSYTLGWLRTEENNYLTTPLEVARGLPVKAQELLGYAAHDAIATGGGYLGTVDTRNPIDLIKNGEL